MVKWFYIISEMTATLKFLD